jgi:hypothetical protein
MDLSGKLIKGTGSYEVKEIAPSIQDGQILLMIGLYTELKMQLITLLRFPENVK